MMKKSSSANLRYETLLFPRSDQAFWISDDLDLYVSVMSEMRSDGWFKSESLSQGIVFHVIHEGRGTMKRGDDEYEVGEGDLFIFWPNALVKYQDSPLAPWRYTWFWLAGTKAAMIMGDLGFQPNQPLLDVSGFTNFKNALDEVKAIFASGDHSSFYHVAAAWKLIDALKYDLRDNEKAPFMEDLANSCRILIENEPAKFAAVGDLARHFNVERSTLFRLFKRAFGVSPKKYIEKVRFEKACQLLSSTDMRIKRIADICGFDNQCYFSAVFQKRSGHSPREWRRISRES